MKKIKLFEQFLNENKIPKLKDLVNQPLSIEIGSSTSTKQGWSQSEIEEKIEQALMYNLFDWDFYYNWTDSGKKYKSFFERDIIKSFIKNIKKTLKDYFTLDKDYGGEDLLKFNIESYKKEDWIDNWFQTSKIPNDIKKDYYDYREKYAGVKLK